MKIRHIFSLVVIFMLSISVNNVSAQIVDKVAAIVNGELITLFELDQRVNTFLASVAGGRTLSTTSPEYEDLRRRVLDSMIDDILIRQEAARLKATVGDAEIESHVRKIRERSNATEKQFEEQLALQGITLKEFKKRLGQEMTKARIVAYMVQRKTIITDEEYAAYAAANEGVVHNSDDRVRLAIIQTSDMNKANDLYKRISSGKISFAEAAKKESIGPSPEKGGEMGNLRKNDLSQEMLVIIDRLSPGQVSQPFVLEGKPALATILPQTAETATAETKTVEPGSPESRGPLYEQLYKEKMERLFQEYMTRLRSKAVIENRL